MAQPQYKEIKEEIVRLHIEENEKESANGKIYPENRLYADLIPWTMTNEKWEVYTGKKIKIVFQKLENDPVTQEPRVKQKMLWDRIVPDQKIFECPLSQAESFLTKVLQGLQAL